MNAQGSEVSRQRWMLLAGSLLLVAGSALGLIGVGRPLRLVVLIAAGVCYIASILASRKRG